MQKATGTTADELDRLHRLEAMVETAPVGIWQTDALGQLVYVNAACYRLAGALDPADPTNSWVSCIHPDDRELVLEAWFHAYETREPFDLEYRFLHPDGRVVSVYVQTAVAEREGYVGTVTDVTERRELAERLEHTRRLETIGRLAGGVAHDFNNLLTVIALNVDLLRLSGDSEELEAIERATERSAQVTSQLLAIARSAGPDPRPLRLDTLLSESSRLLQGLVGERMDFETRVDPDLHAVRADPADLYRILANLVANARDAMSDGDRLCLAVRNATLAPSGDRVLEGRPGPQVVIEVSDTGGGMDADTRRRMFDPGFTTKAPARGTGLGLAAVADLVRRLEGSIEVRSTPGTGTTVCVYLPRAELAAEEATGADRPAPRGRGECVLIVEDDNDVRLAVDRVLRPAGYVVHVAARPSHALELLEQLGHPIDIVVTDVVMPEQDGLSLVADVERVHGPVRALFVSGYAPPSLEVAAFRRSGRAFLRKPFTPAALLRAIRALLDADVPS